MKLPPFKPLSGQYFELPISYLASRYAARLLQSLGVTVGFSDDSLFDPALDCAAGWAASGLIPLTGFSGQPPLQGAGAIPACADGVLEALRLLCGCDLLPGVHGATLLSERAAILGLSRNGQVSANGSCQLLETADGWIAINLARTDDWQLLPAWLEVPVAEGDQQALARQVKKRARKDLVERAALLGLAVAESRMGEPVDHWFHQVGSATFQKNRRENPRVVDLSSLWAGPLCSHLLQQAGASVVKVESLFRPDGARLGSPVFFDLLHAGKEQIRIDFSSNEGRERLRELLESADLVIEGSRPRALQQLGIHAEVITQKKPGLIWLSLTGYGRGGESANRIAFGDDAAVAAGLSAATSDPPVFCGDAIADPLTGLHAALLATACLRRGLGGLFDLSLCNTTRFCLQFADGEITQRGTVTGSEENWQLRLGEKTFAVANPGQRKSC